MRLPRLERRLVLEGAQQVPDGSGGLAEIWSELAVHWAEVRPGTGREAAEEVFPKSSVPMRIIVRAGVPGSLARPRPGQRFREGARLYPIQAVTEFDRRGHYLICHAREEVAT